jgi:hypothetical protein
VAGNIDSRAKAIRWRRPDLARPPPTASTPRRRNQTGEANPERLGALGPIAVTFQTTSTPRATT